MLISSPEGSPFLSTRGFDHRRLFLLDHLSGEGDEGRDGGPL